MTDKKQKNEKSKKAAREPRIDPEKATKMRKELQIHKQAYKNTIAVSLKKH